MYDVEAGSRTRLSDSDAQRAAAFARLGLLDSTSDLRFERLVELTATILGMPIALITLLDTDRQRFLAKVGISDSHSEREASFCTYAIEEEFNGPLVINDARRDERFAANPLVIGEAAICFYAGQTVHDRNGVPLGTLCVLDQQPRTLDQSQLRSLDHLARLVESELARSDHEDLLAELEASERNKAIILDTMAEGMVLQETDGRIIEWNSAAERLLGLSNDELSGRRSTDPDWLATYADGTPWPGETHPAMEALRTGQPVTNAVMGVHRPRDSRVWLRVNASPITDSDGTVTGVLCTFADITAERIAALESEGLAEQLRRGEEMARVSLDALEQGVVLADRSGEILRINPAARRLLGYGAAELTSMWQPDNWITADAKGTRVAIGDRPSARAARTGQPVIGEVVHVSRPDGTHVILRVSCIPDVDKSGAMVVAFADITEETKMLQTLSMYQYLFDHANDLILIIDPANMMLFATPSLHRLFGTDPNDEGVIASLRQRVHPDDQEPINNYVDALHDGTGDGAPLTIRILDRHGEWRHLEIVGVSLDDEPNVAGVVLTARDMTEREQMTRHLAHRATHDALTELPNRELFDAELATAVGKAERDQHLIAVCYLDLDNFKDINDTYGHDVGDELLRGVAGVLLANIRAWDTPARFGGDEFVVLLDPVRGPADALATAHRIRQRLVDLGAQFNVAFGASIGIAFSRRGDTPASLVRRADQALYLAKASSDMPVRVDFEL